MSRIDELIEKLCPDGVGYKELGEACKILRGKRLTKSLLSENEKYPVYHGGLEPLGYYGQSNRVADTVMIINVGASAGTVGYSHVDFWSSDGCYCIEQSDVLMSRYIYYALICQESTLKSKVRVAGIPTLDAPVVKSIKIAVPPLEIQNEIVTILDKFKLLEAELEAELEARKKQYEHYRNALLRFDAKNVEWKTLGEIALYPKARIAASFVSEKNYVGVDNLLQNRQGKTLSSYVPKTGNLIEFKEHDVLIGNIRPYLKKIWFSNLNGGTNGDVIVLRLNEDYRGKYSPKFLYFLLSADAFFDYNMQFAKGAKMPRGDKNSILKYKIPLPPLSEQERIVNILDKFDALVNDISIGLPAEIAARRKQYEYYRNRLLTFKNRSNG
ncbi:MAG: restriction endonuclease subunit S [Chitinophagaceae bacterium]|nr:MAG: restriction endonuclease subunit S [Chitinophagaceae bacterium]